MARYLPVTLILVLPFQDENDNPPTFSKPAYFVSVVENIMAGMAGAGAEGRRLRLTSHTFRLMHTKGERGGARGHRTKLSLYLSTKTEGSSAKNRAELTSPY